jgi:hypothetical protein
LAITGAATSDADNKVNAKNLEANFEADLLDDLLMHFSPDCISGAVPTGGRCDQDQSYT